MAPDVTRIEGLLWHLFGHILVCGAIRTALHGPTHALTSMLGPYEAFWTTLHVASISVHYIWPWTWPNVRGFFGTCHAYNPILTYDTRHTTYFCDFFLHASEIETQLMAVSLFGEWSILFYHVPFQRRLDSRTPSLSCREWRTEGWPIMGHGHEVKLLK